MFDLKWLIPVMMMLTLLACGQKGDLYHPDEQASSLSTDSLSESALV